MSMLFEDKHFIAKKIRVARKNAKFTQEELAEKINISSKQLSRIEMVAYIPSLPTFLKIIYGMNNAELKYYYNIIKTMNDNSFLLKK